MGKKGLIGGGSEISCLPGDVRGCPLGEGTWPGWVWQVAGGRVGRGSSGLGEGGCRAGLERGGQGRRVPE